MPEKRQVSGLFLDICGTYFFVWNISWTIRDQIWFQGEKQKENWSNSLLPTKKIECQRKSKKFQKDADIGSGSNESLHFEGPVITYSPSKFPQFELLMAYWGKLKFFCLTCTLPFQRTALEKHNANPQFWGKGGEGEFCFFSDGRHNSIL